MQKNKLYYIAAAVLAVLVSVFVYLKKKKDNLSPSSSGGASSGLGFLLPRGVRNNNLGNIRISSSMWRGKDIPSKDSEFETFDTMENGVRAAFLNLRTYYVKHGLKTIEGIINRWAPASENNVNAYLGQMIKHSGLDIKKELPYTPETFSTLLDGIFLHENGGRYITKSKINEIVKANFK